MPCICTFLRRLCLVGDDQSHLRRQLRKVEISEACNGMISYFDGTLGGLRRASTLFNFWDSFPVCDSTHSLRRKMGIYRGTCKAVPPCAASQSLTALLAVRLPVDLSPDRRRARGRMGAVSSIEDCTLPHSLGGVNRCHIWQRW
jgi:hypothetical protein